MDLKDQKTQNQIYKKLFHLYGSSKDACGGSSTNTIYAASILGSNCSFIGKVANDLNGKFYVDNLIEPLIKLGYKAKIFDYSGRLVKEAEFIHKSNIDELDSRMKILRVESKDGLTVKKFKLN